MYPSTNFTTAGSGTFADLYVNQDTIEGLSINTSSGIRQISTGGFTASGWEHDDPLELATNSSISSIADLPDRAAVSSHHPSFEYNYGNASTSSLSVNADSFHSTIDMEHVTTGTEENSTEAAQWVNDHVGRGAEEKALLRPIPSRTTKSCLYQVTAENADTRPLSVSAANYLHLGRDILAADTSGTLFPTVNTASLYPSQSQLQLWAYETSPSNQTLAEHLEQTDWEGNTSNNLATSAVLHTPSNALASYEAVMEDEWYIPAVL